MKSLTPEERAEHLVTESESGSPKDVAAQVKTGVVSGTTAEKWADMVLAKRAARKGGRTNLKGEAGSVEPGAAGEAAQILAAALVKGTAHFERGLRRNLAHGPLKCSRTSARRLSRTYRPFGIA